MDPDLEEFVEQAGGVVSVAQLEEYFGADPADIRGWAEENSVARIGNAYCFDAEHALACAEELELFDDDDDSDAEVDVDVFLPED